LLVELKSVEDTSWLQLFIKNSRYPHFCATFLWLPIKRSSFSRSYGCILPSSFSVVLSSALVSSTHPPVSVLVRTTRGLFPGSNYVAYSIH